MTRPEALEKLHQLHKGIRDVILYTEFNQLTDEYLNDAAHYLGLAVSTEKEAQKL